MTKKQADAKQAARAAAAAKQAAYLAATAATPAERTYWAVVAATAGQNAGTQA